MGVPILCPYCGVTGSVPESFRGKSCRCKNCNNHFEIPKVIVAPEFLPISEPPPVRNPGARAEEVSSEPADEFPGGSFASQPISPPLAEYEQVTEADYQLAEPEETKPAFGQILGASSLVVGILGLIFLFLPCFWFLALPISALGLMLGFIGAFWKKGRGMSIGGLVLGAILVFVSGAMVLWAQYKIESAIQDLRKF